MARTATNDPVLIETAERRDFVLQLRRSGATYRQIADATVDKFGVENLPEKWDCRYAHKDVKRELEKLYKEIGEAAQEVRQLQLERLNRLLLAVWERAIQGDYQAVDRAMKLIKQISELTGVDAPKSFELSGAVATTSVELSDVERRAIIEGMLGLSDDAS